MKFTITAALLLTYAITIADDSETTKNSARLERMRGKARNFSISRVSDRDTLASLRPNPVFRTSSPRFGYPDVTYWVWEVDGVPLAIGSVQYQNKRSPMWQYCVTSLASDLIRVTPPGKPRWTATAPGLEFHAVPKAPVPAGKPTLRLAQIKELVRRFEAKWINGELRLLPQPLHRYSHDASGLVDVCIFAFVSDTLPTHFLAIALRQDPDKSKQPEWCYAIINATSDAASLHLDGREIWTKAANYGGSFSDNWFYYLEPRSPANDE